MVSRPVDFPIILRRLFYVTVLAGIALQGQTAKRLLTHERDVETGLTWTHFPRWNGGFLVGYENNDTAGPLIYTVDRNHRRNEVLFTTDDAARLRIFDIAISEKGEVAVVGSAYSSDTRATTFVARITADHRHQTITRVWPYCPLVVTFAADGSVWTIGRLKDKDNTRTLANHVVRRFDSSGKMLGSTTVDVGGWQGDETSFLSSSPDRIGWLTRAGIYIEFGLDGSEIDRYAGPERADEGDISGLALSDSNEVAIGRFGHGAAGFLLLDRTARRWMPVAVSEGHAPNWSRVLGFDGNALVTTTANGRLSRFITQ